MAWLLRWDRGGALEPVALQSPRADGLLGSMPEAERFASWHLVDGEGSVRSAGAAAAPLLRLLPAGRPLAALAERMPATVERGYAWIARHRDAFGGALPQRSRRRAEALIAARTARRPGGVS